MDIYPEDLPMILIILTHASISNNLRAVWGAVCITLNSSW